ncbi:MAG: hydrolase [Fibrobacteres bacterium]|nr:hydrolase [Fibrobacterota bacterium]
MKAIIASDIHGVTPALRSLVEPFFEGAIFLSPWDVDSCPFTNEQEAVSTFIAQQGFESYSAKIDEAAGQGPAFLIGFSVGATAAWLHSASKHCHPSSIATLFYGSRIRDYSHLVPTIEVTAVFAEFEPSASSDQTAKAIARDHVHTFIEPGTFHDFMNPLSAHYAPTQCLAHLRKLKTENAERSPLLSRRSRPREDASIRRGS